MNRIDENGFLEGKIFDWISENRDKHASIFTSIRNLNRECHRFLDGRRVDQSSDLQITTILLFARIMELFQGVVITVDHGMTSSSSILARTLLEAFAHLSLIHKDPAYLGEYLDKFHIDKKKLINRIRNSKDLNLSELQEEISDDLIDEVNEVIRNQEIRNVTFAEVAQRAGLHGAYVTAYAILSGAVHTSASDLERDVEFDEDEQTIKKFEYGPSDSDAEKLLGLAGMEMAEALEIISTIFSEDRTELCTKFKKRFEEELPH